MSRRRALPKIALALVALSLLPVAGARAEAVDGGGVELKLNGSLAKKLQQEGVRLTGLRPGKAAGTSVALPIANAATEPKYGSGYFVLGGGFQLRDGKRVAKVKRLVLNTSKRALNAVVNGIAVKIAALPPQQVSLDGFDLELALRSLPLTPKAASTFNRRLGLDRVYKAGRSLGSVAATAHLESIRATSAQITIAVEGGFREKLQGVEADVVAPVVSMPAEGTIGSGLASGTLSGESGLAFRQPHETPFGEPFDYAIGFISTWVDLGSHVVSGGANVNSKEPRLPFLGPVATFPASSAFQFNPETGEASASSLPLALDPALANLMNEVFGAPKGKPSYFAAGEPFGTASFTAQTR